MGMVIDEEDELPDEIVLRINNEEAEPLPDNWAVYLIIRIYYLLFNGPEGIWTLDRRIKSPSLYQDAPNFQ